QTGTSLSKSLLASDWVGKCLARTSVPTVASTTRYVLFAGDPPILPMLRIMGMFFFGPDEIHAVPSNVPKSSCVPGGDLVRSMGNLSRGAPGIGTDAVKGNLIPSIEASGEISTSPESCISLAEETGPTEPVKSTVPPTLGWLRPKHVS